MYPDESMLNASSSKSVSSSSFSDDDVDEGDEMESSCPEWPLCGGGHG